MTQKKKNETSTQSRELAKKLFTKYGKIESDFITSKELGEILSGMNAPTTTEQAAIMVNNYVFSRIT